MSYVITQELEKGDIIELNDALVYVHEILYNRNGAERIQQGRDIRPDNITGFIHYPLIESPTANNKTSHALSTQDKNILVFSELDTDKNISVLCNDNYSGEESTKIGTPPYMCIGRLSKEAIEDVDKISSEPIDLSVIKNLPKKRVKRKIPTTIYDISLEDAEKFGYIPEEERKALSEKGIETLREAFDKINHPKKPMTVTIAIRETDLNRISAENIEAHPAFLVAQNIDIDGEEISDYLDERSIDILKAQRDVEKEDDGEEYQETKSVLADSFKIASLQKEELLNFVRPNRHNLNLTKSQASTLFKNLETAFKKVCDTTQVETVNVTKAYQEFLGDVASHNPKIENAILKKTI